MNRTLWPVFFVTVCAAIVFIPFLGACPLFDWDEINFAECAREMLVSGDYSHVQLNYRPFWEKPPFFIWLQAISMNVFGVNEFAARFPNAICSVVSLAALFVLGTRVHSTRMGYTWSLLYAATLLPHLYFRSGLIDPWFNLFIFLSLYQGTLLFNEPLSRRAIPRGLLAGLFLGLAVLTKGPAAQVIAFITVFITALWTMQPRILITRGFMTFLICSVAVSCSWFLVEILKGNGDIVQEFISYQQRLFETGDAGHEGPFYYHAAVLLLGCFPASVLFIAAYRRRTGLTPYQLLLRKMMLAMFWTVLIVFSIVKTKIVHYSSLCYFPITFVAALSLAQQPWPRLTRGLTALYWTIAAIISVAVSALTLFPFYKDQLIASGIIKDKFAVMNLQANVHWTGYEWLLALLFLVASVLLFTAIRGGRASLVYGALLLHLVFIWSAITVVIPKVELYSQHAAVAFYKAAAGQNCHIETLGFKSYAYIFYSKRQPADYTNSDQVRYIEEQLDRFEREGHSRHALFALSNVNWMIYGKIDRPAYIVTKTPAEGSLISNPQMKKLYDLNGFSFFVRLPDK